MSKTITISDETYDFIQKFCTELSEQDSRSTRMPYVYAIKDTKRIRGMAGYAEHTGHEWHSEDGETILQSDKEFIAYLDEEGEDIDFDPKIEDEWCDFEKVYYSDIQVIKNVFFTETAANEHLESHHYHYTDPDIQVIHLHGNSEIMNLIICLNEIR